MQSVQGRSIEELDGIARSAARSYQGEFAWFTVLLGIVVLGAYLAIILAASAGALPLPAAALLTMPCVYLAYTVLHEAVHGSISGNRQDLRWINEAMGYVAGWIMMIPLTAHRHEHLTHHRNTNDPALDPDYLVSVISKSPWLIFPAVVKILVSQYRFYFAHRWHKAPRGQNLRLCLELLASFGGRGVFMAAGFWGEGLAIFLIGGLGGVLITMYLFAYIVHHPHEDTGAYVDTSVIEAPAWCNTAVTWLWLFQNYHAVHHLFPRIPFYRYRQLFTEIAPIMERRGSPIYDLNSGGLSRRSPPTGSVQLA